MATIKGSSGPPLTPVEEIEHIYSIPIVSTNQVWSVDIALSQEVDPARHVALLHCNAGFYFSDSGNNYALGYFVQIVDPGTVRLTIQGGNKGYVRSNMSFPIGIYRFGQKPKHTQAAFYNWVAGGANGTVTLSRPFDMQRSVLLNVGSAAYWHGYVKWQDSQTLYCCNYHAGAFVAEF